jgi:hypothetical protein
MSLLQQLVDTIGDSMGAFEEQQPNSNEPQKPQEASATEDGPVKENRDDASCLEEKKEDAAATEQEEKKAKIEITNLMAVTHEVGPPEKTDSGGGCSGDSASNSSVSFGSVRVREYERVIDSTNIYMGLALGWDYNDKEVPLKEKNHASKYSVASSSHGGDRMKRTNGSDRYGMLIRYGYAQKELKQATKEAAQFYKQRSREAARSIVLADQRNSTTAPNKPKRRPLLRSMFG